ncbi:MAG: CARDB domain-containing protein [Thermoplasmatales archaeon]|nr:CARDB domain-containing protein [Thermoplasmatales archaeon]
MKKTILVAALVIIALSLIISLAPKYKAVEINAKESIVESDEDIYVTDTTYPIHGNVTFRQKGNITVSNGVLDIRNGATLQFIQANYEKDRHFMTLNNNSKLIMENNATLTVTPKQLDPWLKFSLTIDNSELYIKDSKIAFPGWITITNSNVTIINSTITNVEEIPTVLERDDNDDCPLLYFENSNVTIINSRIEHYYECTLPEQVFVSRPSNFTFLPGVINTFQFIPSDVAMKTDRLTAVVLEITYEANDSYDGKNFVQYSKDGLYQNTPIQPQNKTDTKIFDLFSEGIDNIKDLEKLWVIFENDGNVNVTFDSVRVVFSYENDIHLVNSKLYAIDTYMDIDFLRRDVDPRDGVPVPTSPSTYFIDADMQHNALRACEKSEVYLYNVTVDSSETGGIPETGNPPFISDDSSTIILYRWLDIRTTDFPGTFLDGVRVEVNLTETPSNIVLDYLGKPINKTENGKVIVPVPTDVMLPKNWPNSKFVGNYKVECYYSNYFVSSNMSFVQFPYIDKEYNTELVTVVFTKLIPEFTVNMDVSNSVMQNEVVQVNATIYNTGTTNAYNVPVIFYDNGEEFGKRNADVVVGGSKFVSVSWTAVSTTPSEVHNISVVVNPLDVIAVIPETNYENNEAYGLVTVYSRPELSVENILFSNPFAVEGDEITISASIFNSGETDAKDAVIKFYKDGILFNSSNISVAAEDSLFVNISFNTSGEGGNVLITVKITNSTPEESNVLNNEKSESIFVYAEHSMVLDSDKVLPPSFTWRGYIIVKNGGCLTLSNATLIMKENTEKQCEIIVLNNGKLIVQNSVITSDANLKLYLYGNSVLTVINSTMMLDIIGIGESEISIQNSVINGTVDLTCKLFNATGFNLNGDLKLNATTVNIENSFINATDISIGASVLYANNTNLTSPLTFTMGNAYLINVTVPQIISIDATIHRSWWLTVEVADLADSVLHNATVNVYSTQTEPFELVASSLTDENGTVVTALPTDTNYLVNVTYENCTSQIYEYIENNTKIRVILPEIMIKPSSLLVSINPIQEVKAGETTNISGTIKYNLENIPVENVTATLTLNGENYPVDVGSDGTYSKEITAPNKGGTYPVKITVVDHAYNLSTADETAQLTVSGKPVPPPDYTSLIIGIVAAIVIIVVVGVIFFKKREKIKPYLLILKAKIKKEEFIECGECGKKIPETFKKCPYCGAEFEEELVKCSECGAFIPASANKCPKCGAMFEE